MIDEKVAVIVLGAPRSGTSLISHIISKFGFHFGDPARFVDPIIHSWNPIFFELQTLNDLNNNIISSQNHDYLDFDWLPLKEDFTWNLVNHFEGPIRNFIKSEFNADGKIGLKDPRFCLTLPIWLTLLRRMEYTVRLVWVVRNLSSCLESNNRLVDDTTPMRPERLVTVSNYAAAYMLDDEEHFIADYDDFIKTPAANVRQLASWLRVSGQCVEDAITVMNPSLRHNQSRRNDGLCPRLANLSQLLVDRKLSAVHYLEFRDFFISHGFEALLKSRRLLLTELRQAIVAKDDYIIDLESTLSRKEQDIDAFAKAVEERDDIIDGLESAALAKGQAISEFKIILNERDTVIQRLESTINLIETTSAQTIAVEVKDARIEELTAALEDKEQTISDLLQSISWRITKPFRLVVAGVQFLGSKALGGTGATFTGVGSETARSERRRWLVQRGLVFYRNYMLGSRLGRMIGQQVLDRGLVSINEIQTAAFAADSQEIQKAKTVDAIQIEDDSNVPGFHYSPPLNFVIDDALFARSCINVILPSLRIKHMSGGPNTALLLAALLAEKGEYVRLIACDAPVEGEEAALFPHMDGLLQRPVQRDRIELVDAFDRKRPSPIGANDLFFATAWWTAQMVKYAVKKTVHKSFIYLIQDFEPILHEGSTFQARALETYSLPHIPVINTRLLLDHLIKESAGCYADASFAASALWFEPALDRSYYFPDPGKADYPRKKVLLFYARPTFARRNLFEIGVVALRQAVASGAIDKDNWEVWAMGEQLAPVALGHGVSLNPLPWMNFDAYAERVRTADILLSLMLSPHPSYPPLEMAASGKLVVTNSFGVKTAQRLKALSPNIVVAEPTAESVAAALICVAGRANVGLPAYDPTGAIALPTNWDESLGEIVPVLLKRIQELRATPPRPAVPTAVGLPISPKSEYECYRRSSLTRRRCDGGYAQMPGLLSFITSAYDTDPVFLAELGKSVFEQDGGVQFEWLILDNGSTKEQTLSALRALGQHPHVRLLRVDSNLGIIGGMRFCLEHATGRYVLPLDSDDLIEPDCVHVLTRFIVEKNYPPLLYTDEDKLGSERFGSPYFKPDWDPVLFLHSCYIAHLCAIDRVLGLELDLYSNKTSEGCHDWDSFIRFMNAGLFPAHVPEVLYSWRIHNESTSGNIGSKTYITESHRNTLQRFLNHSGAEHIGLVNSPLFGYNVDWWFRRDRVAPKSIQALIVNKDGSLSDLPSDGAETAPPLMLNSHAGMRGLANLVNRVDSELIHICWQEVKPDDGEWQWDAMALLELFPDAVMVGGILHDGKKIIDGPRVFGFGEGFDCPDRGRLLADPGYGARMWKPHSVSALPAAHCVIRTPFLRQCMTELLTEDPPLEMLGLWLGARARESGARVVYSPFMRARLGGPGSCHEEEVSSHYKAHFMSRFWAQIPDQRVYSPRLGLDCAKAYTEVDPDENLRHCLALQKRLLPYPAWLKMHLRRRRAMYPVTESPAPITLITTVYEGTNISLLDMLAESVSAQTIKVAQWVIVAHGPINAKHLDHIVSKGAKDWAATVIVETQPLGIMRAMRRGMDAAHGEYVVPVDADDLLTPDAVQILTHFVTKFNRPDMLFSDEDLLIDEVPTSPYLRAGFDPVLNLDSSYIWHLCAINRSRALALDLYTDLGATWCHDWDSVMRMSNAGGRIEHVAEVLYHWRQHSGSTTNNSQGDSRSLDSVRYILERQIARYDTPTNWFIADWPINRGSRECYIARHSTNLPEFVWIGDLPNQDLHAFNSNAILVVTTNGVVIESKTVHIEVARIFELHAHVGVVGGVVIGADGKVVDGCYMTSGSGKLESPWVGQVADYAGPYALAQKAQTVSTAGKALAFFRMAALQQEGVWSARESGQNSNSVIRLVDRISVKGWSVAFSPMVRARSGIVCSSESSQRSISSGKTDACFALNRYGAACSWCISSVNKTFN